MDITALAGGPITANDNTWELGHELFLEPMDSFSVYEHWTHRCNCTRYRTFGSLSWVEPADDGEGYYIASRAAPPPGLPPGGPPVPIQYHYLRNRMAPKTRI